MMLVVMVVVAVGVLGLLVVSGATRQQRRVPPKVYGRFYPSETETRNARRQREEQR